MKKRFFAILMLMALAASLLIAVTVPAAAAQEPAHVVDECAALEAEDIEAFEAKAARIKSEYGIDAVFVLTDNSGDAGITSYIDSIYTGTYGASNDGIIFGHDVNANLLGIVHYGRCEELIPEEKFDVIAAAYNDESTYSGGIAAYFDTVYGLLSGTVSSTEAPVETAVPAPTAVPAGEPGVRIQDMAGLLSESQRLQLRETLDTVSRKHNCDVVVITCKTLGHKDPKLYAADFYEAAGFQKNGIVMLVCPEERDYAFCATGDGMDAMTRDAYNKLENTVVEDELHYDDYYNAFRRFAQYADEFLTAAENGKPYSEPLIPTGIAGIGAAIIGLITGGIGTSSMKSKLKSVHRKNDAFDYLKRDSLNIAYANDTFLYSNVVATEIPREERSGSSGSGGFHSSSGSSWSGSSGKY